MRKKILGGKIDNFYCFLFSLPDDEKLKQNNMMHVNVIIKKK